MDAQTVAQYATIHKRLHDIKVVAERRIQKLKQLRAISSKSLLRLSVGRKVLMWIDHETLKKYGEEIQMLLRDLRNVMVRLRLGYLFGSVEQSDTSNEDVHEEDKDKKLKKFRKKRLTVRLNKKKKTKGARRRRSSCLCKATRCYRPPSHNFDISATKTGICKHRKEKKKSHIWRAFYNAILLKFKFKFKFIKYIITIYNLYYFCIVYKMRSNLSNININQNGEVDLINQPRELNLKEYERGYSIRGVQGLGTSNQMDVLRTNMLAMETLKPRSFCKKCGNVMHINPTFCTRKCHICLGDHWTKECAAHDICSWCGKKKGAHKCNEVTLAKWFLLCPLCRLVGHSAADCTPLMMALSQTWGPLKPVLRRRRNRRRRYVTRRSRWIGLGRRRRRRWRR